MIDQAQQEIDKMTATRREAIKCMVSQAKPVYPPIYHQSPEIAAKVYAAQQQIMYNAAMAHPPALTLIGRIKSRPLMTLGQALARIKALTMDRRRSNERNGSEGM